MFSTSTPLQALSSIPALSSGLSGIEHSFNFFDVSSNFSIPENAASIPPVNVIASQLHHEISNQILLCKYNIDLYNIEYGDRQVKQVLKSLNIQLSSSHYYQSRSTLPGATTGLGAPPDRFSRITRTEGSDDMALQQWKRDATKQVRQQRSTIRNAWIAHTKNARVLFANMKTIGKALKEGKEVVLRSRVVREPSGIDTTTGKTRAVGSTANQSYAVCSVEQGNRFSVPRTFSMLTEDRALSIRSEDCRKKSSSPKYKKIFGTHTQAPSVSPSPQHNNVTFPLQDTNIASVPCETVTIAAALAIKEVENSTTLSKKHENIDLLSTAVDAGASSQGDGGGTVNQNYDYNNYNIPTQENRTFSSTSILNNIVGNCEGGDKDVINNNTTNILKANSVRNNCREMSQGEVFNADLEKVSHTPLLHSFRFLPNAYTSEDVLVSPTVEYEEVVVPIAAARKTELLSELYSYAKQLPTVFRVYHNINTIDVDALYSITKSCFSLSTNVMPSSPLSHLSTRAKSFFFSPHNQEKAEEAGGGCNSRSMAPSFFVDPGCSSSDVGVLLQHHEYNLEDLRQLLIDNNNSRIIDNYLAQYVNRGIIPSPLLSELVLVMIDAADSPSCIIRLIGLLCCKHMCFDLNFCEKFIKLNGLILISMSSIDTEGNTLSIPSRQEPLTSLSQWKQQLGDNTGVRKERASSLTAHSAKFYSLFGPSSNVNTTHILPTAYQRSFLLQELYNALDLIHFIVRMRSKQCFSRCFSQYSKYYGNHQDLYQTNCGARLPPCPGCGDNGTGSPRDNAFLRVLWDSKNVDSDGNYTPHCPICVRGLLAPNLNTLCCSHMYGEIGSGYYNVLGTLVTGEISLWVPRVLSGGQVHGKNDSSDNNNAIINSKGAAFVLEIATAVAATSTAEGVPSTRGGGEEGGCALSTMTMQTIPYVESSSKHQNVSRKDSQMTVITQSDQANGSFSRRASNFAYFNKESKSTNTGTSFRHASTHAPKYVSHMVVFDKCFPRVIYYLLNNGNFHVLFHRGDDQSAGISPSTGVPDTGDPTMGYHFRTVSSLGCGGNAENNTNQSYATPIPWFAVARVTSLIDPLDQPRGPYFYPIYSAVPVEGSSSTHSYCKLGDDNAVNTNSNVQAQGEQDEDGGGGCGIHHEDPIVRQSLGASCVSGSTPIIRDHFQHHEQLYQQQRSHNGKNQSGGRSCICVSGVTEAKTLNFVTAHEIRTKAIRILLDLLIVAPQLVAATDGVTPLIKAALSPTLTSNKMSQQIIKNIIFCFENTSSRNCLRDLDLHAIFLFFSSNGEKMLLSCSDWCNATGPTPIVAVGAAGNVPLAAIGGRTGGKKEDTTIIIEKCPIITEINGTFFMCGPKPTNTSTLPMHYTSINTVFGGGIMDYHRRLTLGALSFAELIHLHNNLIIRMPTIFDLEIRSRNVISTFLTSWSGLLWAATESTCLRRIIHYLSLPEGSQYFSGFERVAAKEYERGTHNVDDSAYHAIHKEGQDTSTLSNGASTNTTNDGVLRRIRIISLFNLILRKMAPHRDIPVQGPWPSLYYTSESQDIVGGEKASKCPSHSIDGATLGDSTKHTGKERKRLLLIDDTGGLDNAIGVDNAGCEECITTTAGSPMRFAAFTNTFTVNKSEINHVPATSAMFLDTGLAHYAASKKFLDLTKGNDPIHDLNILLGKLLNDSDCGGSSLHSNAGGRSAFLFTEDCSLTQPPATTSVGYNIFDPFMVALLTVLDEHGLPQALISLIKNSFMCTVGDLFDEEVSKDATVNPPMSVSFTETNSGGGNKTEGASSVRKISLLKEAFVLFEELIILIDTLLPRTAANNVVQLLNETIAVVALSEVNRVEQEKENDIPTGGGPINYQLSSRSNGGITKLKGNNSAVNNASKTVFQGMYYYNLMLGSTSTTRWGSKSNRVAAQEPLSGKNSSRDHDLSRRNTIFTAANFFQYATLLAKFSSRTLSPIVYNGILKTIPKSLVVPSASEARSERPDSTAAIAIATTTAIISAASTISPCKDEEDAVSERSSASVIQKMSETNMEFFQLLRYMNIEKDTSYYGMMMGKLTKDEHLAAPFHNDEGADFVSIMWLYLPKPNYVNSAINIYSDWNTNAISVLIQKGSLKNVESLDYIANHTLILDALLYFYMPPVCPPPQSLAQILRTTSTTTISTAVTTTALMGTNGGSTNHFFTTEGVKSTHQGASIEAEMAAPAPSVTSTTAGSLASTEIIEKQKNVKEDGVNAPNTIPVAVSPSSGTNSYGMIPPALVELIWSYFTYRKKVSFSSILATDTHAINVAKNEDEIDKVYVPAIYAYLSTYTTGASSLTSIIIHIVDQLLWTEPGIGVLESSGFVIALRNMFLELATANEKIATLTLGETSGTSTSSIITAFAKQSSGVAGATTVWNGSLGTGMRTPTMTTSSAANCVATSGFLAVDYFIMNNMSRRSKGVSNDTYVLTKLQTRVKDGITAIGRERVSSSAVVTTIDSQVSSSNTSAAVSAYTSAGVIHKLLKDNKLILSREQIECTLTKEYFTILARFTINSDGLLLLKKYGLLELIRALFRMQLTGNSGLNKSVLSSFPPLTAVVTGKVSNAATNGIAGNGTAFSTRRSRSRERVSEALTQHDTNGNLESVTPRRRNAKLGHRRKNLMQRRQRNYLKDNRSTNVNLGLIKTAQSSDLIAYTDEGSNIVAIIKKLIVYSPLGIISPSLLAAICTRMLHCIYFGSVPYYGICEELREVLVMCVSGVTGNESTNTTITNTTTGAIATTISAATHTATETTTENATSNADKNPAMVSNFLGKRTGQEGAYFSALPLPAKNFRTRQPSIIMTADKSAIKEQHNNVTGTQNGNLGQKQAIIAITATTAHQQGQHNMSFSGSTSTVPALAASENAQGAMGNLMQASSFGSMWDMTQLVVNNKIKLMALSELSSVIWRDLSCNMYFAIDLLLLVIIDNCRNSVLRLKCRRRAVNKDFNSNNASSLYKDALEEAHRHNPLRQQRQQAIKSFRIPALPINTLNGIAATVDNMTTAAGGKPSEISIRGSLEYLNANTQKMKHTNNCSWYKSCNIYMILNNSNLLIIENCFKLLTSICLLSIHALDYLVDKQPRIFLESDIMNVCSSYNTLYTRSKNSNYTNNYYNNTYGTYAAQKRGHVVHGGRADLGGMSAGREQENSLLGLRVDVTELSDMTGRKSSVLPYMPDININKLLYRILARPKGFDFLSSNGPLSTLPEDPDQVNDKSIPVRANKNCVLHLSHSDKENAEGLTRVKSGDLNTFYNVLTTDNINLSSATRIISPLKYMHVSEATVVRQEPFITAPPTLVECEEQSWLAREIRFWEKHGCVNFVDEVNAAIFGDNVSDLCLMSKSHEFKLEHRKENLRAFNLLENSLHRTSGALGTYNTEAEGAATTTRITHKRSLSDPLAAAKIGKNVVTSTSTAKGWGLDGSVGAGGGEGGGVEERSRWGKKIINEKDFLSRGSFPATGAALRGQGKEDRNDTGGFANRNKKKSSEFGVFPEHILYYLCQHQKGVDFVINEATLFTIAVCVLMSKATFKKLSSSLENANLDLGRDAGSKSGINSGSCVRNRSQHQTMNESYISEEGSISLTPYEIMRQGNLSCDPIKGTISCVGCICGNENAIAAFCHYHNTKYNSASVAKNCIRESIRRQRSLQKKGVTSESSSSDLCNEDNSGMTQLVDTSFEDASSSRLRSTSLKTQKTPDLHILDSRRHDGLPSRKQISQVNMRNNGPVTVATMERVGFMTGSAGVDDKSMEKAEARDCVYLTKNIMDVENSSRGPGKREIHAMPSNSNCNNPEFMVKRAHALALNNHKSTDVNYMRWAGYGKKNKPSMVKRKSITFEELTAMACEESTGYHPGFATHLTNFTSAPAYSDSCNGEVHESYDVLMNAVSPHVLLGGDGNKKGLAVVNGNSMKEFSSRYSDYLLELDPYADVRSFPVDTEDVDDRGRGVFGKRLSTTGFKGNYSAPSSRWRNSNAREAFMPVPPLCTQMSREEGNSVLRTLQTIRTITAALYVLAFIGSSSNYGFECLQKGWSIILTRRQGAGRANPFYPHSGMMGSVDSPTGAAVKHHDRSQKERLFTAAPAFHVSCDSRYINGGYSHQKGLTNAGSPDRSASQSLSGHTMKFYDNSSSSVTESFSNSGISSSSYEQSEDDSESGSSSFDYNYNQDGYRLKIVEISETAGGSSAMLGTAMDSKMMSPEGYDVTKLLNLPHRIRHSGSPFDSYGQDVTILSFTQGALIRRMQKLLWFSDLPTIRGAVLFAFSILARGAKAQELFNYHKYSVISKQEAYVSRGCSPLYPWTMFLYPNFMPGNIIRTALKAATVASSGDGENIPYSVSAVQPPDATWLRLPRRYYDGNTPLYAYGVDACNVRSFAREQLSKGVPVSVSFPVAMKPFIPNTKNVSKDIVELIFQLMNPVEREDAKMRFYSMLKSYAEYCRFMWLLNKHRKLMAKKSKILMINKTKQQPQAAVAATAINSLESTQMSQINEAKIIEEELFDAIHVYQASAVIAKASTLVFIRKVLTKYKFRQTERKFLAELYRRLRMLSYGSGDMSENSSSGEDNEECG